MRWTNIKELKKHYPVNTVVKKVEGDKELYGKVAGYDKNEANSELTLKVVFDLEPPLTVSLSPDEIIRATAAERKESKKKNQTLTVIDEMSPMPDIVGKSADQIIVDDPLGDAFDAAATTIVDAPPTVETPPIVEVKPEPPKKSKAEQAFEEFGKTVVVPEKPKKEDLPVKSETSPVTTPDGVVVVGAPAPSKASQIRAMLNEGKSRSEIAKVLGVTYRYVYHIEHLPLKKG